MHFKPELLQSTKLNMYLRKQVNDFLYAYFFDYYVENVNTIDCLLFFNWLCYTNFISAQ